MSRKWERMVEKNSKLINERRKKQGKKTISANTGDGMDYFYGRRWIFTAVLILFDLMYVMMNFGKELNGSFWFIVISYALLALFTYYGRKPYLAVGKSQLSTRKYTGFKYLKAEEIQRISCKSGFLVVEGKDGRTRWVFSRPFHLYPVKRMGERLDRFSKLNQIEFINETK